MTDIKSMFSIITDKQFDLFETYFKELVSYNEKVNLTAITEKEDVYIKHFYDSCLGCEFVPTNAKVVDVGTGAGFPGVPIKIARDDIELTLVDSLNKRIVFLNELKQKLNIDYLTFHARAEDFCSNASNRESFDICVSRAVAKLNTLAEYCLPLVKIGGRFIAYKSGEIEAELEESAKAINILGGQVEQIKKIDLPNNKGSRTLIIIKKIKNTSKIYPRNKNLPKTKPIQ